MTKNIFSLNFAKKIIFCLSILPFSGYSQDNEFQFKFFTVKLEEKKLFAFSNSSEIFSQVFEKPSMYLSDLDDDGNDELLVKDEIITEGNTGFLLYIFNTLDTFFLSSAINSGSAEPYEVFSGEIEGLIIVSGNPDFNIYNKNNEVKFLPVNCWKFEEGELYPVNDLLYDPFIEENNNILAYLENIFSKEDKDCTLSIENKAAIASAYINYLNAGEQAIANSVLKTYYLCDDYKDFIYELNNMFNQEVQ